MAETHGLQNIQIQTKAEKIMKENAFLCTKVKKTGKTYCKTNWFRQPMIVEWKCFENHSGKLKSFDVHSFDDRIQVPKAICRDSNTHIEKKSTVEPNSAILSDDYMELGPCKPSFQTKNQMIRWTKSKHTM